MQETKIVDGFIFAVIDEETAKDRLKNCECIYRLHSDDTESLIEDENELNDTLLDNDKIGVEIGLKSILLSEFDEEAQNRFRNNDDRNFDQWLNDKINLILE
jgi:hypothetical protein